MVPCSMLKETHEDRDYRRSHLVTTLEDAPPRASFFGAVLGALHACRRVKVKLWIETRFLRLLRRLPSLLQQQLVGAVWNNRMKVPLVDAW